MGMKNLKNLIRRIDKARLYKEWGGKTPTEYFRELRAGIELERRRPASSSKCMPTSSSK